MNSPPRTPTLLSDAAHASTRNHVLADLERRKSTTPRFGRRRNDRRVPWRSVMVFALLICGVVGMIAYLRTPASPAITQVAQPVKPISTAALPTLSPSSVLPAESAAPEPPAQVATIISASPTELAADARSAAQHDAPRTVAAAPAAPMHHKAPTNGSALPPAAMAEHRNAAATSVNQSPAKPGVAMASQPTNTAASNKNSDATNGTASSNLPDSDVDLLAALIARVRQRDPTPTKTPSQAPCSGQSADSICSR